MSGKSLILETLAAGPSADSNKIGSNSQGNEAPSFDVSSATEESELVHRSSDATEVDDLFGNEDAPEDSSDKSTDSKLDSTPKRESDQKTSEPVGDKEVIVVTDEKGRRRKVEIDYSDRKAIRKAFEMEHGARKWQADRDQAISGKKQIEAERDDYKSRWDSLEDAFSKGHEHLYDMLTGQQGAFQSLIEKEVQKREFLKNASPEEAEAFNMREKLSQLEKQRQADLKKNEEFRKQVESEREQAETRAMESRIHPVFTKYRFAEKLGDANDEQMFDEMLWNTAMKRLEPYENEGLEISPELVEREFRAVASSIRKRIGLQAEKKASNVIEQKKKEATENVQAQIKSGYKASGIRKEANDLLNSGNTRGFLRNFNKYRGLLK